MDLLRICGAKCIFLLTLLCNYASDLRVRVMESRCTLPT